jgi:hypothetical protein
MRIIRAMGRIAEIQDIQHIAGTGDAQKPLL